MTTNTIDVTYHDINDGFWTIPEHVVLAVKEQIESNNVYCAYCGRCCMNTPRKYLFHKIVYSSVTHTPLAIPRCGKCFRLMADIPDRYKKSAPGWLSTIIIVFVILFAILFINISVDWFVKQGNTMFGMEYNEYGALINNTIGSDAWLVLFVVTPFVYAIIYGKWKYRRRKLFKRLTQYYSCGSGYTRYDCFEYMDIIYYMDLKKRDRAKQNFNDFAVNYKTSNDKL